MGESKEVIRREAYSPRQTADIRRMGAGELVGIFRDMPRHPARLNLTNPEETQRAVDEYLDFCAVHEVFPSVEGLCTHAHISREWFYRFLRENARTKTGELLEDFRNLCIAVKISGNERGCISDASLIFQLKNIGSGFADKIELMPPSPEGPWDNLNAEEARRRMMESIPDEE